MTRIWINQCLSGDNTWVKLVVHIVLLIMIIITMHVRCFLQASMIFQKKINVYCQLHDASCNMLCNLINPSCFHWNISILGIMLYKYFVTWHKSTEENSQLEQFIILPSLFFFSPLINKSNSIITPRIFPNREEKASFQGAKFSKLPHFILCEAGPLNGTWTSGFILLDYNSLPLEKILNTNHIKLLNNVEKIK